MLFKILFFLILLNLTLGCSGAKSRNPASIEKKYLKDIISSIEEASGPSKKQAQHCRENFNLVYKDLFEIAGAMTLSDTNDIAVIDREIESSFKARLALNHSLKNQNDSNECLKSKRDVFRALRIVEDYLLALRMEKAITSSSDFKNLSGDFPLLKINPIYKETFKTVSDLKNGDVILFEESDYSVSALSRLTDSDHYYSQFGVVTLDPIHLELMVNLNFFEVGEVSLSIPDFMEHTKGRIAIYRPKKSDAVMDINTLGKNENKSPEVKEISPFILSLSDKSGLIGLVGDIQFDSRFEQVLEWSHPRKIEESRLKEMILTKIFNEIEKNSYLPDPSPLLTPGSRNLWLLRRSPPVRKKLEEKNPLLISSKQQGLFMAVDKVGEEVFKILEKKSLEFDRPMTPLEIYLALDNIFQEDIQVFKSYIQGQDVVKPAFHLMFHP